MKIALHMGTLRGAGSSYIGRSILRHLCAAGAEHEFLAWVPASWDLSFGGYPSNCEVLPVRSGIYHKLLTENVAIRRTIRSRSIGAVFSLGDTSLVGCPVPQLLMVQQAYLAYMPAEWGFRPAPAFAVRMKLIASYFRLGLPHVSALTVQTHDMKARLCERWNICEKRVHVVPSPLDFEPLSVARLIRPTPSLCYIATAAPHKNFEILPRIMEGLANDRPHLRCVLTVLPQEVPGLVRQAKALGVLHMFEFLGHLPKEQALSQLSSAQVALIPSNLESFGLGYYEAMALGIPIVASDKGFAREACGQSALYAVANDSASFVTAVARILEGETLGTNAFGENRTTWKSAVSAYLQILTNII